VSRTILKGILYVCKVGYKNNMQDKHLVIVHTREDRDVFINKVEYSKTVYHPDVDGGKAESGDIIVDKKQCMDWIFAKYIVDNYDNLHEYTIFCQAIPDDHVHEPLLAINSTFKGGFGSLCYARSIYNQYYFAGDNPRYHPISFVADLINLGLRNADNINKSIFLCHCGAIFFVHRDNIRKRPKSFYQNIIDMDDDELLLEKYINHEPPDFFKKQLDKAHPSLSHLNIKDKLLATYVKNKRADFFGTCMEPLWFLVFCNDDLFNKINNGQAAMGNRFNINLNLSSYNIDAGANTGPFSYTPGISIMNFKRLENSWFDFDCSNYQKWHKTLIEKTIITGKMFGIDGRGYLEHLKMMGVKHISF